jgi:hypothetical protein
LEEIAIIKIVGGGGFGGGSSSGSASGSTTKMLESMGIRSATSTSSQLGIRQLLPEAKSMASGMTGMLTGAMTAAGAVMGIGSVVMLIKQLVEYQKLLLNIIGGIIKLVGFLLKPITDVIGVLLMPILFMLKPFVLIANQVMAPFIKDAMKLMQVFAKATAKGDMTNAGQALGGAALIMFSGLGSVIVAVFMELIKLVTATLFDMAKQIVVSVLGFFSSDMAKEASIAFDYMKNTTLTAMDGLTKGFVENQKNGADRIMNEITGNFNSAGEEYIKAISSVTDGILEQKNRLSSSSSTRIGNFDWGTGKTYNTSIASTTKTAPSAPSTTGAFDWSSGAWVGVSR